MRLRGRPLTVRLIGIDTPESVAPGEPVGCFALEASAYTTERLDGERVRLEFDVERIDPFGRTLAYAWLGDELFNETLVREGYAFVTTFPPNVRYVDRFRAAQGEARQHEAHKLLLTLELGSEVEALRSQSAHTRAVAQRFREESSQTSSALMRTATAGYEGGELGLFELLDAFRGAADDELAALDMELSARHAAIELDRLTGAALP